MKKIVFVLSLFAITANLNASDYLWMNEPLIEDRICKMELEIDHRVDSRVMARIRRYVTYGKRDTEALLGRTSYYFPVFEHYLRIYNLPEELKYLPMIESGLQPTIKSHVGATGLWQIMDQTALQYGLKLDGHLDERQDVYKSTEAAAKILRDLYVTFGDWSLVLAAYNAGPARVQKAMRDSGGKNFWEIEQYLPKETQMYVPSFIAASYVANYYPIHQLTPRIKLILEEPTRVLSFNRRISFKEIALISGVQESTLARLNPGVLNGLFPGNTSHLLVLPASKYKVMREFLFGGKALNYKAPENTLETEYVVLPGDTPESIALRYDGDPQLIRQRNDLGNRNLIVNEQIVLYLSKRIAFNRA
jgi:membrane-bound lytic murein transglycosylase D